MMYILTEEEFAALKAEQAGKKLAATKKLQTLCSKIADTMPVKWGWGGPDPKPWGCMLTSDGEWYCDECPVTEICPEPGKSWSK